MKYDIHPGASSYDGLSISQICNNRSCSLCQQGLHRGHISPQDTYTVAAFQQGHCQPLSKKARSTRYEHVHKLPHAKMSMLLLPVSALLLCRSAERDFLVVCGGAPLLRPARVGWTRIR